MRKVEQPLIRYLNEPERSTGALREHLPRNEVAVVLHHGEDDFIAFTDIRASPTIGDEINRLRSVPREDNLACARRVD